MMRSFLVAASLAMFTAGVSAQAASVSYYGNACRDAANSVSAPVFQVTGVPQIGATMTVRYLGPSGSTFQRDYFPALITGLSTANFTVPRLTLSMATDCTLLVTPDVAVFFLSTLPPVDRISYQIPNTTSALGATVFHQFATVALSGSLSGNPVLDFVVFSNGARVYCGL